MFSAGADPSHIIEEKELVQLTDEIEITKIIEEILKQNQKAVDDFRKGKTNVFQFLIGQIMNRTRGKANPELVNKILKERLSLDKKKKK